MKLNCDLGEGFACEGAVMPFIDQANIACDAHAGSMELMRQTVILAREHRVSIGAHPGYPDRENFGRISLESTPEQITEWVTEQVAALASLTPVDYVKPHGALYQDMMSSPEILAAIRCALGDRPLMIQAQFGVMNEDLGVLTEAFADRRYTDAGDLLPRGQPGSLLNAKEIEEQVYLLLNFGEVKTDSGRRIRIKADSLCVHGDNPDGVRTIRRLREIIDNA